MIFNYGIDHLTVDKILNIANGTLKATINEAAISNVNECRGRWRKWQILIKLFME